MNKLPSRRVLMSIILLFAFVLTGAHAEGICPPNFPKLERHTEKDHGDVCRNEKFHGYNVGWKCPYGCIPVPQHIREEPIAPYCTVIASYVPCRIDTKRPQGLQQRSYDCGNNVGGYDCEHSFGPGYFCCDFGNGRKSCATKEGCPTDWSQKQPEIKDENCPVISDFKPGGFNCPRDNGEFDCLNGNIGYSDLALAWKKCGQIAGCEKIMKYSDGKFYLRRSTDEKFQDSRVQYVDYRCQACEDNDEEIRKLTYGVYKSCWLMVLSNNLKCKNSGEGIAPYAENCRFSCGHCNKDPKDMDIVDIIHSHENLTTLAFAIANAHFITLLRSTKENFTLFAPHNDAFDEDLITTITSNETGTFDLLSRHKVVGHGRFTTDKIEHGVLMTVNNYGTGIIEIWRNGTTDAITVVERQTKSNNPFATIVERDIPASNGVIHILDGVL